MNPPLDVQTLDKRAYAFDAGRRVAEVAFQGQLGAGWAYLTPTPAWCAVGRLSLRDAPHEGGTQVSEALLGEALELVEPLGDWAWVRTLHDGYLGYARADGLTGEEPQATMPVTALRGHLYAAPRVSARIVDEVAWGARLPILGVQEVNGRAWYQVAHRDGPAFVGRGCLEAFEPDLLAFARRFLDAPYVWGGRSAGGLDCSGFVQLAYASLGRALPRDADQQQAFLAPVDVSRGGPRAGDLAFFPGHVGLMLDERRMIHANGEHMRVTVETLGEGAYGERLARECTGYGRWMENAGDRA